MHGRRFSQLTISSSSPHGQRFSQLTISSCITVMARYTQGTRSCDDGVHLTWEWDGRGHKSELRATTGNTNCYNRRPCLLHATMKMHPAEEKSQLAKENLQLVDNFAASGEVKMRTTKVSIGAATMGRGLWKLQTHAPMLQPP